MPRTILLLRGINVGGHNKLPMAELRSCLEMLGATDAETYVQSGNVAATLSTKLEKTIARDLAKAIAEQHGFEPAVLKVSSNAFRAVIERNPYPEAETTPTKVHVFFLESKPSSEAEALLAGLKAPSESFKLDGRVFYLHAPDGIGRSRLAAGAEAAFGCAATSRNWRTVRALEALL